MQQAGIKFYISRIRIRPSLYWKPNKPTHRGIFRIVLNATTHTRRAFLVYIAVPLLTASASGVSHLVCFSQLQIIRNFFLPHCLLKEVKVVSNLIHIDAFDVLFMLFSASV